MLRFFRHIRQNVLQQGKVSRYLGYAIGEIVLIMIGIFLALQLNNWNEDRKAQTEFDEYIVQLKEDVRAAIKFVKTREYGGEIQAKHAMTILNVVEGTEAPENLEAFEDAMGKLGKFAISDIPYGNLRDLLDGNLMRSLVIRNW